MRRLIVLPVDTPSRRLLADKAAQVLAGMANALNGAALLVADARGQCRTVSASPGPPGSAASYRWRRHNGTIGLDSLDIRKLTLPIFAGGRLRNELEPRKSQKCRQWSMRS